MGDIMGLDGFVRVTVRTELTMVDDGVARLTL